MTTKRRRYLGEIVTQDPRIDRFKLMNLRDFHPLIDLMHGSCRPSQIPPRGNDAAQNGHQMCRRWLRAPGSGLFPPVPRARQGRDNSPGGVMKLSPEMVTSRLMRTLKSLCHFIGILLQPIGQADAGMGVIEAGC